MCILSFLKGNIHSHCASCRKTSNESKSRQCRLSYPRPFDTGTVVRKIIAEIVNGRSLPRFQPAHIWNENETKAQTSNNFNCFGNTDNRLLDYPLHRQYIHFDLELFPDDPAGYYEVMRRQIDRQNVTLMNLNKEVFDSNASNHNLFNVLSSSMVSVGYGSLDNAAKLVNAEHRDYIYISKLQPVARVNFVDYCMFLSVMHLSANRINLLPLHLVVTSTPNPSLAPKPL